MKYSEDCHIREWQGRRDEIKRLLYDLDKCDYYLNEQPYKCVDILYELREHLRKRKRTIEKYLDEKGSDLY